MTRNFKIISLVLLLVAIAMSALAVTGAFAEEEEEEGGGNIGTLSAEKYPATLDGTDVAAAGVVNAFTFPGLQVECPDSSYSGTITKATSTFTITPTYSTKCFSGARKATVITNGCSYQITIQHTTDKNGFKDNYFFWTDILCPPGQDIEIRVYEAADNENVEFCKVTIKEQLNLKNRGKVQNEVDGAGNTTGTIFLENAIKEIVATKSGKCGDADIKTGVYDINNITIKGTDSSKGANKIKITDT
jgi:hypothetical protein